MKIGKILPLFAALALFNAAPAHAADATWQMVPGKMTTRWAHDGRRATDGNSFSIFPSRLTA